jgi:hypothetical protein
MPGFSQRARVSGGDSVVQALRSYVANAADLVADAVREEQEDLVSRQQDRAQADPRWSELASQVNSWEDDDGSFATGVRDDDDAVSKASRLEFGDEHNPPSPLLRMGVLSDVADINWRMTDTFRRGGY